MKVFEEMESEVRSYCRNFDAVFTKARNAQLWDSEGRMYIDFFAGAGALNYGHNNLRIRSRIVEYMLGDGIAHSLDMATEAKMTFLTRFRRTILEPRGLDYKVMFPGPTGTNAVESALKLARKVTGRTGIVCFTNAFHGMTLGSLAATGNKFKRGGAGVPLAGTAFMPYDGYCGAEFDTVAYLEKMLADAGSGLDLPAAVILETLQGEGGLNCASEQWLRNLEQLCRRYEILLIVDDVQMGCGRTGTFFSFEKSGIRPDIVCLSKSIGGFGLPMAITLIKPEYDAWMPGEHNGTFRGNNLAFIAAAEALDYWSDDRFEKEIGRKAAVVREALEKMTAGLPPEQARLKGKGMIQGISFGDAATASQVCREAFKAGLILETSGPADEVVKLMPPLTIEDEQLVRGLELLAGCVDEWKRRGRPAEALASV